MIWLLRIIFFPCLPLVILRNAFVMVDEREPLDFVLYWAPVMAWEWWLEGGNYPDLSSFYAARREADAAPNLTAEAERATLERLFDKS